MATGQSTNRTALMRSLRLTVYSLAGLLGLSLLVIGSVAVIAELKGTWHWMIHLQSTVSYMVVFITGNLLLLVPLAVLMVYGNWRWE